jgi:hypothetical protein
MKQTDEYGRIVWIIWSAQMTNQMLRIKGRSAPLAMGACACIEFIMPAYRTWGTAAGQTAFFRILG